MHELKGFQTGVGVKVSCYTGVFSLRLQRMFFFFNSGAMSSWKRWIGAWSGNYHTLCDFGYDILVTDIVCSVSIYQTDLKSHETL